MMRRKMMALCMMVCVCASFVACSGKEADTASKETQASIVEEKAGTTSVAESVDVETDATETENEAHSDKSIVVEVVDSEGVSNVLEVETDAEVLLDVIQNMEGLTIDGNEEDWGYYITTINGIVANYDEDGAYWALYVNDEMAEFGIAEQPVVDGDSYSFKYEVYSEE